MDAEQLKQQLMATFKVQLEEHLGTLNKGLIDLEKTASTDDREAIVDNLFRAAHSIKGAARAVDLSDIEDISHRMEEALGKIKQGTLSPAAEVIDALLGDVDALQDAMNTHLYGSALPDPLRSDLEGVNEAGKQVHAQKPAIPETLPQRDKGTDALAQAADTAGPDEPMEKRPQSVSVMEPHEPKKKSVTAAAAADTIRVATHKLDRLMDGIGELLVARMQNEERLKEINAIQSVLDGWEKGWRRFRSQFQNQRHQLENERKFSPLIDWLSQAEANLKHISKGIQHLSGRFEGDYRHLTVLTDDIQNSVQRIRMVPVSHLFDLFPRMVRDLSREQKKEVSLIIEGQNTEIDRQILESMKDPLTHLLRNAVDHGIEMPPVREAAGKASHGTVILKAFQKGNSIAIEVSDDGAGIDLETVWKKALKKGLSSDTTEAALNRQQAIDLIFLSGFSTMETATHISGRGIGMDVVKKNLEKLHGLIAVKTEQGKGTRFTLTLPLTLATSHVLLLEVAGQTVAVPTTSVQRILNVDPADVGSVEGKPALSIDGQALPLISMARVLEWDQPQEALDSDPKNIQVIVLGAVEKKFAFIVDKFSTTQEVVVKNIGKQLSRVRNVSGATILGTGQVVIVVNVPGLIHSAQKAPAGAVMKKKKDGMDAPKKVLVVDDSITTRTLEKNVLEIAGYEVCVAVDGLEGWESIQNETLDAVVLDVDMPRMNGFELTQKIKEDKRFGELPVILVTSLDSDEHKLRGMEAGADAYITKGSFDQIELLETIKRLIG